MRLRFILMALLVMLINISAQAQITAETADGQLFRSGHNVMAPGELEPLQPRYTFVKLGTLPGYIWSGACALNNSGQLVGMSGSEGFIWKNGIMSSLLIAGADWTHALCINDSGQIATMSRLGCHIWQDGNVTEVGLPDIIIAKPTAINNAGCVCGWTDYIEPYSSVRYGFIWNNGRGTILYPPRGESSFANDLNNSGVVAGQISVINNAETGETGYYPCVWRNGVAKELPLPKTFKEGCAMTVNNSGIVGGYCYSRGPYSIERALIWRNGRAEIAKQADKNSSDWITKLNDWGQAIGIAYLWPFNPDYYRVPVIWQGGIPHKLDNVIANMPKGWQLFEAVDINNNGQIAVIAFDENDTEISLLLTPIPAQVTIDIKPGDPSNVINPKSRGIVPVAVFSNDDCKASSILPETATLAGAKALRWQAGIGSGKRDLIIWFRTEDMQLTRDTREATLKARTFDGWWIEGKDKITMPGGKKAEF